MKHFNQVPVGFAESHDQVAIDLHRAKHFPGLEHDFPVFFPVMRAFCALASGFIKNFFGGGIEANPDDVCTGVLNLLQPVFVQKGGGDQC